MEALPFPNQEATAVVNHLVDEIFMRFSVATRTTALKTGQHFESQLISEVCKLLHIKKTKTISLYPQCDAWYDGMLQ